MMKAFEQERLTGTSGNSDYLLIARVGRCAIGLKCELGADTKLRAVALVLRVRVCADPKIDFSKDLLTATEIYEALPHIPMPNTDNVRGSTEMMGVFKIRLGETVKQGLMNRVHHKDTITSFAAMLAKRLKVELDYDEAELAAILQERWERLALKFGAPEGDEGQAKKAAANATEWLTKLVADHNSKKPGPDAEPA
jgi:hypothetical protein